MPDPWSVVAGMILAAFVLAATLAPRYLPRRRVPVIPAAHFTPRRCLETERATVAHHRAEITQELPAWRDGHTVPLRALLMTDHNGDNR